MMMQSGAGGFLRNIGAEACLGFEPVITIETVQAAVLHMEMMGVVADLIFGRLRCGSRILV